MDVSQLSETKMQQFACFVVAKTLAAFFFLSFVVGQTRFSTLILQQNFVFDLVDNPGSW